jgi:uncharacterized protein YkwD
MKIVAVVAVLFAVAFPWAGAWAQPSESAISIAFVDSHAPVTLPAQANALAGDLNAERAKHGLPTLVRDATLDRFAYAKAVDMAARGYFGHTDPDGVTFQDRVRAWNLQTYAAENIAFDRNERAAHAAFVKSPPHFANLVDPNSRRVGVAVVTVGPGETFYVEDFGG